MGTCLETENFDTIASKVTQHAARLLKKPMQMRAVSACTHLFWCDARKDGGRVVECLQKCLKVQTNLMQSDCKSVGLWVELLDKYIFFFESCLPEVPNHFIENLINLCNEHIAFAEQEQGSAAEAAKAKAHLTCSVAYLKMQQQSGVPEVAAKFAELNIA